MTAKARARLGVIAGLALIFVLGIFLWKEGYFHNAQMVPAALAQAGSEGGICAKSTTATPSISVERKPDGTAAVYWAVTGAGDFAPKFQNCKVSLYDEKSGSCIQTSTKAPSASFLRYCDAPTLEQGKWKSNCKVNDDRAYHVQIACVSEIVGAQNSQGKPVAPEDSYKMVIGAPSTSTSTDKLPEPPPPVKPRYREF
ncbi:MAG: hypothetical protein FJY98_01275 [Candidatus Liptonbacteria bacterium]|nr:hypothetical protein [Candidatus Liptonbacteria bacterium]